MALKAHLVIRHEGCIVSECLTDGAHAAQVSSDRGSDVIVMHGEREDQVEAFWRALVATQRLPPEVIQRTPRSLAIRGRNPEDGVVMTLFSEGATILWPSVWRDGLERYVIVVADGAHLERVVARASGLGEVRVERVAAVEPAALGVALPAREVVAGLTPRQEDAFLAAVSSGYYESPRHATTTDISARFDIARSTYEEHLRKAERRVMERFAQLVERYPELAKSATRAAGRPASATKPRSVPRRRP